MTLVKGNSVKEINTSLLSIQKEVDDINKKIDSNTVVPNNNSDIKIDTVLNGNSKNAIANSAVYNALNIEAVTRESQDEYLNEEIYKLDVRLDEIEKQMFLIAHPVGSYWSTSEDTDPNVTYGGTWEKITGKFLYAADNENPVGSTGGSKTNILTVDNLPSHSHSFTPSGRVSAHTHSLNNHTHSFTPRGSLNSTGAHTHTRGTMNITSDIGDSNFLSIWTTAQNISEVTSILAKSPLYYKELTPYKVNTGSSGSFARLQFDASRNWTGSTSSNGSHTHTFTGAKGTTEASSIKTTTSTTPTFTGTKGNTENTGSATAINNMPPYLGVNTWHRIN